MLIELGLGAFQLGFPSQLASIYRLAEEALPFESPCLDWHRFTTDIPNRLWHRPDAKYVEWLDRMIEAKVLVSYHKLLPLQGRSHESHSLGYCLLDRPSSPRDRGLLSQKTPNIEYKEPLSFAPFINHYAKKGPVKDSEHVAFLLYWLNKFIFCVSANRVTKAFIDLACALASGQKLALGPLVLAHLYRGMEELISNKFIFAPGPLWIMTLWPWSYFPKLALLMNKSSENTCYVLHYVDTRGSKYAFGVYFKFFYHELTSIVCVLFDKSVGNFWPSMLVHKFQGVYVVTTARGFSSSSLSSLSLASLAAFSASKVAT
ncbi:hypothetical protein RHMOL_Rhmol11G0032200 [Rhododendron molle]|uniref:Uncharacterized protein n=1 Tax=Rhododendron molle TaxID=49168 RepID=A0ACC0LN65_RHOML|nr:hypothetical protein RHMOL_Rhmol11G0032200 [Rhododendron molle]